MAGGGSKQRATVSTPQSKQAKILILIELGHQSHNNLDL